MGSETGSDAVTGFCKPAPPTGSPCPAQHGEVLSLSEA